MVAAVRASTSRAFALMHPLLKRMQVAHILADSGAQVLEYAQQMEYPLQCTMEPDDDGKEEDES